MNPEICGNCKWHMAGPGDADVDWICENEESEYWADITPYGFTCPDWGGR